MRGFLPALLTFLDRCGRHLVTEISNCLPLSMISVFRRGMTSSLFWEVTHCRLVVSVASYRSFGTTFYPHLLAPEGADWLSKKPVSKYQSALSPFQYNLSFPASRVNMRMSDCPETSVTIILYCVTSQKSEYPLSDCTFRENWCRQSHEWLICVHKILPVFFFPIGVKCQVELDRTMKSAERLRVSQKSAQVEALLHFREYINPLNDNLYQLKFSQWHVKTDSPGLSYRTPHHTILHLVSNIHTIGTS
jgi:hypothetical protein